MLFAESTTPCRLILKQKGGIFGHLLHIPTTQIVFSDSLLHSSVEYLKNCSALFWQPSSPRFFFLPSSRLFGTFRDSRHVYLLLEFCQGGELWAKLREVYEEAAVVGLQGVGQKIPAVWCT